MVESRPNKMDDSEVDQTAIKLSCHVLWPAPTVCVRIVKPAGATGARPKTGSLVEAHSYSLVILNPEKMLLVPGRCAAGQTRETGVRCARLLSLRHRRRKSRRESAPRSTLRNLINKFKIGQHFFTPAATAEIVRESSDKPGPQLWKSNWIRLF
jgi:hypothetical protein